MSNRAKRYSVRKAAAVSACGGIAIGIAATVQPEALQYVLLVALPVGTLAFMRRRLAPALMSPVTIVSGGLLAVASMGLLFYSDVQHAREGGERWSF